MASSGSYTFALSFDKLIEEASKLAGGEPITGGDLSSARVALDLLFIDMQNRGILAHTLEMTELSLVASTTTYDLSSNTLDIIDAVVRISSRDYDVTRIGFGDYIDIPLKGQGGRPTQFFVDRKVDGPDLYVWPVPTSLTAGTFIYWAVRDIQDAGKISNTPDLPRRYYPSLLWGLAFYLASTRGHDVSTERVGLLKMEYESNLRLAFEADGERVPLRIVPRIPSR